MARQTRSQLFLDTTQQKYSSHERSDITDFELIAQIRPTSLVHNLASKLLSSDPRRLGRFDTFARRNLSLHISREIGFDSELQSLRGSNTLIGYFQTFRFFTSPVLDDSDRKLTLVRTTNWFDSNRDLLVAQNPIVVHVRRGDYRNDAHSAIGVLNKEYYLRAIAEFQGLKAQGREIWVFSDSISDVKEEFGQAGKDFRFVSTPPEVSAAEIMVLMSMASSIVISNSTYSYWAALSGNVSEVVCPEKWFRVGKDPSQLLPPTWTRIESLW